MSYGSLSTGRKISNLGDTVFHIGAAQYMSSYLSKPKPSGKIWTGMTKSQAKLRNPDMLKNSKKYDWRPRGDRFMDGLRDSNLYQRSKKYPRGGGIQTQHWKRQPKYNQGIYSQTTDYDLRSHRKSQARRGAGKVTLGQGMRFLGKGLMVVSLGTYASWLYEDPSLDTLGDIAFDMTGIPAVTAVSGVGDNHSNSGMLFPMPPG